MPSDFMEDPRIYDMDQDCHMDYQYPEEVMSMAQAIFENDPIYLPENQHELEEIIRRGQEASRRLQQGMAEEQEDTADQLYDWETPES